MISQSILFRQHHFLEFIRLFDVSKGPLDVFMSLYFRHNPQLGSKDRLYVVERVYTYFRWKLLIEVLMEEGFSLLDLVEKTFPIEPKKTIPAHVRVSFPEEFFKILEQSYGKKTEEICLACNEKAPITLRVNSLKIQKEDLKKKLEAYDVEVKDDECAEQALFLNRRINLTSLPEFREGFFEIQDAGSQKVADLLEAHPGDLVLDYCAGAGGKTLAFAHRLQGKGQIFLYDLRGGALDEARKRLRRAGVENAQFIYPEEDKKLSKLRNKMDWVLLDVPCSGTGTLRRSPDIKWKFSRDKLDSLIQEQRAIFAQGISFLKKGGRLLYATCSLLPEENESQVEYFLQNFPVEVVGDPFSTLPTGLMDGFFAVRFRLK